MELLILYCCSCCVGKKMTLRGNAISLLALVLLLSISLVKGQCDNSDTQFHSDKNDDYDADYIYSPEGASTCVMLCEQFEQSLLNDHLNLYKMRRVFFPNGRPKPIVVTVAYSVRFHNITDEPCAGIFNESTLVEENSTSITNFSATVIWTSSITFSVLHPEVIDWLTPGLLYLLGPIRASYFNHSSSDVNVHLILNVPFLPCTPSPLQVMDVLNDITTMVSPGSIV